MIHCFCNSWEFGHDNWLVQLGIYELPLFFITKVEIFQTKHCFQRTLTFCEGKYIFLLRQVTCLGNCFYLLSSSLAVSLPWTLNVVTNFKNALCISKFSLVAILTSMQVVLCWSVAGKWKHEKSQGHEDYGLSVSQPAKK
jgi:hypothetical protein